MTKWAILIGVDFYARRSGLDSPLQDESEELSDLGGCVQDVNSIKRVLVQNWGFRDENITSLISRGPADKPAGEAAGLETDASPTYENIINTITLVTKNSRPGDIVYIQFSGCIWRVPTATPHIRNLHSEDLDLALFPENVLTDGKCLYDVELAVLLHRLTTGGREVTLVIDGRFTVVDIPMITTLYPPALSEDDTAPVSYGAWSKFGKHTWLQNPTPGSLYTFIMIGGYSTVSGSIEYTEPGTNAIYGFLTYQILKLLKRVGHRMTYKSFARHITMVAKSWLERHVFLAIEELGLVVAGGMDRPFLGEERQLTSRPPNFPVTFSGAQGVSRMRVEGGMAHGLKKGDRLVLVEGYSPGAADGSTLGIVEVTLVYGLFSLCQPTTEISAPHYQVSTGSDTKNSSMNAILVLHPRDAVLPSVNAATSVDASRLLSSPTNAAQRAFQTPSDMKPPSLQPRNQAELYRSLLQVKHQSNEISKHISFSVVGGYGYRQHGPPSTATFGADGYLHLVSGDYVVLHLLGALPRPMFVRALCFDSTFGIEQVYPVVSGRDDSFGAESRSELVMHIRLSLPVQTKLAHATEVLKVFVTGSPSSFEALEIPPISDEVFLREHPDPAATTSSQPVEGPGNHREADDEIYERRLHEEFISEEDLAFSDSWCCFEARFVIHKSKDTVPNIE